MRTIRDILEQFPHVEHGLISEQVEASRQRFGSNRLSPPPRKPAWKALLEKFTEPIIKILLLAAGVSLLIGLATGGSALDGLAILIAVILATGVAFLSEYQSEREFQALNAGNDTQRATVIRDSAVHTVSLDEVVVGDAVILETGAEVPADGRVLKANDLGIDQSLMTGETEPVYKQVCLPGDAADGMAHAGCLYRGTQLVDGAGEMIVTEVGDVTYLGQVARELSAGPADRDSSAVKPLTPLQLKLSDLARRMSKVGYAAAGAVFVVLLVQGLLRGELGWTSPGPGKSVLRVLDYFLYAVIVIVVAVPEGLPMSVALSLALAMRKMTRANSLVRQLVACETIGSATVICTDKTGTLTLNQMNVVEVMYGGQVFDVKDKPLSWSAAPELSRLRPLEWIVLNAAVNSTAHLEEKDGKLSAAGNSTEGALLRWLHDGGIDYRKLRLDVELLSQVHFSSARKQMKSVIRYAERQVLLVKGAPDVIREQCSSFLSAEGSVQQWTHEARSETEAQVSALAQSARRTLAFAFAVSPPGAPPVDDDLVYTGAVAIRDPLRSDVADSLQRCQQAGIEVKIITGDSIETARAISSEIGLLNQHADELMTSQQFNALGDDDLKKKLPSLRVLARAQPLDKLRMVKLLQEQDQVVAVTGDGANDAPALKRADVGLAMGRSGTAVAKEASKIVLLDDAFSTIVKAVHWGRALYENIQRFIQFQLTINVSALAITILASLFGIPPPFTILQLLWINVIMDTLASIALCSEPPRAGLMHRPPKRRTENIITRAMARTIAWTGGFFVLVMMSLLLGMHYHNWFAGAGAESAEAAGLSIRQASIFFTVYVFFQVWNEINCRSLTPDASGLRGLFRNRVFLGVMLVIIVLQVLFITFGGALFHVEALGLLDWLGIAAATSSVVFLAEFVRYIQRATTQTTLQAMIQGGGRS